MTHDSDDVLRAGIGEMLISSRSLDEYRSMFNLTDEDLSRRILDCPGGAAGGFTSAVNRLGGDVTASDTAYFDREIEQLAVVAAAETERGNRYIRAHAEQFDWTFFADPDEHARVRRRRFRISPPISAGIRAAMLPDGCRPCRSPTSLSISCSARTCCSAIPTGSTTPSTSTRSAN